MLVLYTPSMPGAGKGGKLYSDYLFDLLEKYKLEIEVINTKEENYYILKQVLEEFDSEEEILLWIHREFED